MKSRRWFLTPELIQWRYMVTCGQSSGPFFLYPYLSLGMWAKDLIGCRVWLANGVIDRIDTGLWEWQKPIKPEYSIRIVS